MLTFETIAHLEKYILITMNGLLKQIRNNDITIDEAEKLLFTPHTASVLKKQHVNEDIVYLIMRGCELEDLEIFNLSVEEECIRLENIVNKKLKQYEEVEFIDFVIKEIRIKSAAKKLKERLSLSRDGYAVKAVRLIQKVKSQKKCEIRIEDDIKLIEDHDFWLIISEIKKQNKAYHYLSQFDEDTLAGFYNVLVKKLYTLYKLDRINDNVDYSYDEDIFLAARSYIISRGETYYYEALAKNEVNMLFRDDQILETYRRALFYKNLDDEYEFNSQLLIIDDFIKGTSRTGGYICPVCGHDGLLKEPYYDGKPSMERCDCCGFKFGYSEYHDIYMGFKEDFPQELLKEVYDQYRRKWLLNGRQVFNAQNFSNEDRYHGQVMEDVLERNLNRIGQQLDKYTSQKQWLLNMVQLYLAGTIDIDTFDTEYYQYYNFKLEQELLNEKDIKMFDALFDTLTKYSPEKSKDDQHYYQTEEDVSRVARRLINAQY